MNAATIPTALIAATAEKGDTIELTDGSRVTFRALDTEGRIRVWDAARNMYCHLGCAECA